MQPLPGGSLFRCKTCFLKFRNPLGPPDFYAGLYNNEVTTNWQHEIPRNDWGKVVDFMRHRLHSGASVLDFGCNTGGLLARLDGRHKKHGIEINASAAAVAAARSGATIWPSIDEMPTNLRFDAIVLSDIVEHVANPRQLITTLAGHLAEDGVLIITTGDADAPLWDKFGANWWYCVFPEHITFISRAWLNYLVRSTSMAVLHCESFSYFELPLSRKLVDRALMVFYGVAPRLYSASWRMVQMMLGNRRDAPIRGVGVSADHLFIVLANNGPVA